MTDIHDLQESGESLRQAHGIDGTMGDAQDVPHPFVEATTDPSCIICGLAEPARAHVRWSLPG